MSQSLEIPDELFSALQAAAEASGTTPVGWIAAHLPEKAAPTPTSTNTDAPAKTLADLFAGRVGRIRTGKDERLSEDCGEKFTDYLEAKRRDGHL